ncbi:Spy/CpxP family protein refolding chaperone [Edaphobacter bradus]|uniref:Spy/CpxP family protein refolding chaperone n=1 Tax=Edaphobacter bradus TaxID=2259016 RepID=UPI0021DFBED2|nr:Spy/CpxP family protein refolding chaperone [Edaphobacter bradus]
MMKTLFRKSGSWTAALALVFSLLCAMPLMAQDTAPPPGLPQAGHRGGPGMGEHNLKFLTEQLNLTPDQVSQVKAIDDNTMSQMKALRDDTSLSPADRHAKMMDLHKASQDKIRALLTDDQKTKYDALRAEMKAKAQERMQNRNGGGAPPPPPPPQ